MVLSYTDLAVTTAEADAYATARDWRDWASAAEGDKTPALRRGQDYIAGLYNGRWATEWDNDQAPEGVKMAIFEAARRELVEPGSLLPDWSEAKQVKRERSKVGPIEEEFEYSVPTSALTARPTIGIIDHLLADLITSAGGVSMFKVTRA